MSIAAGLLLQRNEFLDRLIAAKQEALAHEIDAWLSEHLSHHGVELYQEAFEGMTTRGRCGCGETKEFRHTREAE